MRPKAEWAIDSEAIRARGIIFTYCSWTVPGIWNPQHEIQNPSLYQWGNKIMKKCKMNLLLLLQKSVFVDLLTLKGWTYVYIPFSALPNKRFNEIAFS